MKFYIENIKSRFWRRKWVRSKNILKNLDGVTVGVRNVGYVGELTWTYCINLSSVTSGVTLDKNLIWDFIDWLTLYLPCYFLNDFGQILPTAYFELFWIRVFQLVLKFTNFLNTLKTGDYRYMREERVRKRNHEEHQAQQCSSTS